MTDRQFIAGQSSTLECRSALLEERLYALAEVLRLRRGLLELGLELELLGQGSRVRMLEEPLRHRDSSRRERCVPLGELLHTLREPVLGDLLRDEAPGEGLVRTQPPVGDHPLECARIAEQ